MSDVDRIEAYLSRLPADQREALQSLREMIAELAPDAEEAVSYAMPAFKVRKRPLIGYSASKAHLSVHPFSADVIDAHRDRLSEWTALKGTINFTPDHPLTREIVASLLASRRAEIGA